MTPVDLALQDRRPDALAGDRVRADRPRQGAATELRALLAAGGIRPLAAAAAAAELHLQRDQIHPARQACWSAAAATASRCRSASTTPASASPCMKRGEIFKEFHRLEQGARIARGLGLGLSIVERLARVLNHGIALDANAGGGSVFSVTVPIAQAINHTAAVTSATPLSRTPMSGALIVCIENDPAILDGMKTLLTAWDAEVIAVADPEAAISAIEAAGGRGHRAAGRLSSRPRQRRRRDPRHPPPLRRQHSGDPDHRRPQPAGPRRGARGEYRGAQQAGEAGLAAGAARPVAHPADGARRNNPNVVTSSACPGAIGRRRSWRRRSPPACGFRRRAFAGSRRHGP